MCGACLTRCTAGGWALNLPSMESNLMSILVMLIGIALGCLTVWLSLRSKARQAYQAAKAESTAQLAIFQERIAARGHDLLKLQEAFDKEVAERERLRE